MCVCVCVHVRVRVCVCVYVYSHMHMCMFTYIYIYIFVCVCIHACTRVYIYIYTHVCDTYTCVHIEGKPKAPFSIAATPRCRGGHYSFLWIALLTLDTYLIILSVKQGSIKYPFLSLWFDSTWN